MLAWNTDQFLISPSPKEGCKSHSISHPSSGQIPAPFIFFLYDFPYHFSTEKIGKSKLTFFPFRAHARAFAKQNDSTKYILSFATATTAHWPKNCFTLFQFMQLVYHNVMSVTQCLWPAAFVLVICNNSCSLQHLVVHVLNPFKLKRIPSYKGIWLHSQRKMKNSLFLL